MFIQGVFFNWDPLKVSEFTYRLTLMTFRGVPVKRHPVVHIIRFLKKVIKITVKIKTFFERVGGVF